MNKYSLALLCVLMLVNVMSANAQTNDVTSLPLKLGYYVASDVECKYSSNATVVILRHNGVGGSRDFCEFKEIVKTGVNTYQVTESCSTMESPDLIETSKTIYTISNNISFVSKSEFGWERSARYCEQSSMSEDFRTNDISDLIN